MKAPDGMDKFRYRLRCKVTIVIDMVLVAVVVTIMVGLDLISLLKAFPEVHLTALPVISYSLLSLGYICGIVLFLVGFVVLRGPCRLSPYDMDTLPFEKGIKQLSVLCSIEFLRFIVLSLGLSFRLMVFSLVAFDELTDYEVLKQGSIILPITSILLAWFCSNKYKKELETHLKNTLMPIHATAFQQL